VAPERHRPCPCRYDFQPDLAWRRSHLPELARRELHPEGEQEDVPAGLCSILSQLARDDRLAVVEGLELEAPKTKLLAQKLKAMGLDSVLVITDGFDENLYLASRNLVNVLVVEPRYADPVSLVHYKKVLITKPALAKVQEMLA